MKRGQINDLVAFERELWEEGISMVAGVDEVGRGALAGPLVAAAVILPKDVEIPGIADSKKLTAKSRADLFEILREVALSWAWSSSDSKEIDSIGIQKCNIKAMVSAVGALSPRPQFILSDHYDLKNLEIPHRGIDKGDSLSRCIAAASIMAKVLRDRIMQDLHEICPQYGFKDNKGYGTSMHLEAIEKYGPSEYHRYSFKNVGQMRF